MARINPNFDKLAAGYLFPEINKRTAAFQAAHPGAKIIRLGIGNTTEPIPAHIVNGLMKGAEKLGDLSTYTGYGDEQGDSRLRKAIGEDYARRGVKVDPLEIFVSDGAKSDLGNLMQIFPSESVMAVQDPTYPAYVDTKVIVGGTGEFNKQTGQYDGIVYMPCNRANGFFPEIPKGKVDLVYLCSPNNPTGAVATKEQLTKFVNFAREQKAVLVFDAAYAPFVRDDSLPKSIYEVPGAEECAIEVNSFSKIAGFTGVRLGWTVVPQKLQTESVIIYDEKGKPKNSLNALWNARQTRFFNGASNIAQEGGLYALTERGRDECSELVDYYRENARLIRQGLEVRGIQAIGGENAPYVWLENPNGMKSWDFFDKLLKETEVVSTPGSGFGPSGEYHTRLSAFGHRANVVEAVDRIVNRLKI